MEFNKDYLFSNINPFLSINSILLLRQSFKTFNNYIILKQHKFIRNIYLNYTIKTNILDTFNNKDNYLIHLHIDSNYFNTFNFFNNLQKKCHNKLHNLTITTISKNPQFIINNYVKYFIHNILIYTPKYSLNINLTFPLLWNIYTFNLYNNCICINTLNITIYYKSELYYLSTLLNTHNIFINTIIINNIILNIDNFKSYWIDYFKYELINDTNENINKNIQNIILYTKKKHFNILFKFS